MQAEKRIDWNQPYYKMVAQNPDFFNASDWLNKGYRQTYGGNAVISPPSEDERMKYEVERELIREAEMMRKSEEVARQERMRENYRRMRLGMMSLEQEEEKKRQEEEAGKAEMERQQRMNEYNEKIRRHFELVNRQRQMLGQGSLQPNSMGF
jgi:hypothetical protein